MAAALSMTRSSALGSSRQFHAQGWRANPRSMHCTSAPSRFNPLAACPCSSTLWYHWSPGLRAQGVTTVPTAHLHPLHTSGRALPPNCPALSSME